jgi:PAS domain S-box-containing protein
MIGKDQNIYETLPGQKLSPELLEEERLKGTRLSVIFRWVFILLTGTLLTVQLSLGHTETARHGLILIILYFITNLFFWYAVVKKYNPPYLGFLGGTIDIGIICYHIYGMAAYFDPAAATAAATIFLIPIIFMIYTFRLNRLLLLYLVVIAIIGFNLVYFYQFSQAPGLFSANISLSPISHIFKSVYIIAIGLLCIYMQKSITGFIEKHLADAALKNQLDADIRIEQQKNRFAAESIEKERALNVKLEEEIKKKDAIAKQLKANKEQIKSIISNLVGFTYRCLPDKEWTMLFISDQVEDVTGYKPEVFTENSGMSFNSIVHPDDLEFVNASISEAITGREKFDLEYRLINKNGDYIWVHEAGRGVYDQEGNILFIDGNISDISEKRRAEDRLRETQELVKSLTSNLVGAVSRSLYDEYLTTKYYSEKIFEITGYKAEDFVDNKNVRFIDIIYYEDLWDVWKQIRESVNNNTPYSLEFRIVHKSGKVIWLQENGRPVFDKASNTLYLDGITTEITDKKNAEQALIDAKQELEKLNHQLEKTVEERTEKLTRANTQLLKLQKENLQSQFEVLKQQVNPHFLFNSLNVLTSLIKVDADLAEIFTEKLSKVYRYVLENKDKDLVTLGTELDFIKSYIFLLNIRFAGKVSVKTNIADSDTDRQVVPLALQLLMENAIKHNTFSMKNPLNIEISSDGAGFLIIANNLQNRRTKMISTKVGLINISKRYALLSDLQPVFEMTEHQFIARIPLLDAGYSRHETELV